MDTWIVVLVSSIAGAVVALSAEFLAHHLNKKLAKETADLHRPRFRIEVFHYPIDDSGLTTFCLIHPGPENVPAAYPLSLLVHNAGGTSTDDFIVTLTASMGIGAPTEALHHEVVPEVLSTSVRRGIAKIGNFTQVSYAIPSVGPHSSIEIIEPLTLTPTIDMKEPFSVACANAERMSVMLSISMTVIYTVTVISQRAETLVVKFQCMCIEANDIEVADKRLQGLLVPEQRAAIMNWGKPNRGAERKYRLMKFARHTEHKTKQGGLVGYEMHVDPVNETQIRTYTLLVPEGFQD